MAENIRFDLPQSEFPRAWLTCTSHFAQSHGLRLGLHAARNESRWTITEHLLCGRWDVAFSIGSFSATGIIP